MKRVLAVVLFSVVLPVVSAAAAPEVSGSISLGRDFSDQPIPKFSKGYVTAVSRSRSGYSIWDKSGKFLGDRTISIPGVSNLSVREVATSKDGKIAVSASLTNEDGKLVAAILWLNQAGDLNRIVQTSPYAASHIAFGEDGTLWAFGRSVRPDFTEETDYATLRHYDADGKQILACLPRSSFPGSLSSPSHMSLISVGQDRVGVLSQTTNQWVEVSFAGVILQQVSVRGITNKTVIPGIAFDGKGEMYATIQEPRTKTSTTTPIRFCRLDKVTGTFTDGDLGGVLKEHSSAIIAGDDGGQMVMRVKPSGNLLWVSLP